MKPLQTQALRCGAVLWMIWGLVHALAGVLSLNNTTVGMVQAIADATPPETLVIDYPPAASAILDQHAWNLLWAGFVTMVGAVFIWRRNMTAIWFTALVGGLLDIGYFVFIDLGGFCRFIPGTLMTIFSSVAIVLTGWVWLSARNEEASH